MKIKMIVCYIHHNSVYCVYFPVDAYIYIYIYIYIFDEFAIGKFIYIYIYNACASTNQFVAFDFLTPLTSGWGISPQPNINTEFYIAGESHRGLCLAILQ